MIEQQSDVAAKDHWECNRHGKLGLDGITTFSFPGFAWHKSVCTMCYFEKATEGLDDLSE